MHAAASSERIMQNDDSKFYRISEGDGLRDARDIYGGGSAHSDHEGAGEALSGEVVTGREFSISLRIFESSIML